MAQFARWLKRRGYLSLHFSDDKCLFITEIAVDEKQKKGFGAILMRFADTLARQSNCLCVRLNAIENKITFYEGFGALLGCFVAGSVAKLKLKNRVVFRWIDAGKI
ncbi:MAG: GNAT family N-acetyltransferase [Verrucomicrobiia bacterium]